MAFTVAELMRSSEMGASPWGIPAAKPPFNWGKALQAGGAALKQAGKIYPTGAEQKIAGQLGFASAAALRIQAAEAPKAAAWEIERARKERKRVIGQQIFTYGYAGVEISGTALDILEETKREMELNEEQIYREGQLSEALFLEEAEYMEAAAYAQIKAGKAAAKAGKKAALMGGVGTGAMAGFMVAGPPGALVGGILGGVASLF